jgi:hypothetical protein
MAIRALGAIQIKVNKPTHIPPTIAFHFRVLLDNGRLSQIRSLGLGASEIVVPLGCVLREVYATKWASGMVS